MGDSLRSNAERLLRDVQMIHSRMMAQVDRIDGGAGRASPGTSWSASSRGAGAGGRGGGRSRGFEPPPDDDVLDVPEFIPPG